MKRLFCILMMTGFLSSCSQGSNQFTGWQDERFDATQITQSNTKTFVVANLSADYETHINAVAFDRGSNAAGHFRIEQILVGEKAQPPNDIVLPPGSSLKIRITYAPQNLTTTRAAYGDWVTGEPKRWIPKNPNEVDKDVADPVMHRAILEALYDYPNEGIFYVQLIGEALPGPNGEETAGGAFATCRPGDGIACYKGGFALDLPQLAPGGPKDLEISGPIKINLNDGSATLRMDDFPYVVYYLRSEEIPQLPSGVSATLVLSGSPGAEATGTFDGVRLSLKDVVFRIRVALGELTLDQIKQSMSALVDFKVPDLEITTSKPLNQGKITLHLETTLPTNPSGNELFDQFLSGVKVIAIMDGEFNF